MQPGHYYDLRIDRFTSVGAYLCDEEGRDVLLPTKYLTSDLAEDDVIKVFVYKDSEDRPVATTETPFIQLGGYAYLHIKDVSFFGAFADWGLEKDLLIPFKEQHGKLEEGKRYLITLQYDEATDRLYGSTKIRKYLELCTDEVAEGDEVDLLVWEQTDLGLKVIVNNRFNGLIFNSDLTRKLYPADQLKGFVHQIREDGKIDIRLEPAGYEKVGGASDRLLDILKKHDGILNLTDKSDPEEIRKVLAMSKKVFKQAIGKLYKERLIELKESGIVLLDSKRKQIPES